METVSYHCAFETEVFVNVPFLANNDVVLVASSVVPPCFQNVHRILIRQFSLRRDRGSQDGGGEEGEEQKGRRKW